jgi:transcriptional regulator with XRE-family HTH domain
MEIALSSPFMGIDITNLICPCQQLKPVGKVTNKICTIAYMKLGDRIRKCREQKDMSQEDLGKAIGQTQQTIAAIEDGTIENPRRLRKIAEVLGVTEAYLRFGESPSQEDEERFTEAQFLVEQFLISHRKSMSLRDKFVVVSRLYLHMKRCNQVTASEAEVKRAFMDM